MIDINSVTEADRPALEAELRRAEEIKRKLRSLDEAKSREIERQIEEDFKTRLLGRLFFRNDPSQGIIELVRPTGLKQFSKYGSCEAARLIVYTQGKCHHEYDEIRFKRNDTIRLDSFDGFRLVDVTHDPDLMRIKFDDVLKGYLDSITAGLD